MGEYLSDELRERGWTVVEFAEILGRPVQAVSEILNGRKEITPTTASEIAAATGTSAETWLRLQDTYRLWELSQSQPDEKLTDVARRARLTSMVPLRELRKRGEIPEGDLEVQERAVCNFLGIPSLEATPGWALSARRSESDAPLSPPQLAWLGCVRRRAAALSSTAYDAGGLELLAAQLTATIREPEDLLGLPAQLAAVGVRLVHTVRFDDSKIDGAAFFDDIGPVIGLSGRIAKLDSVLFTLLHEIAHIHLGHVEKRGAVDIDLLGTATNVRERQADKIATRWAMPKALGIKAPISRGGASPAPSRWACIQRWLSGGATTMGCCRGLTSTGSCRVFVHSWRRGRRAVDRSEVDKFNCPALGCINCGYLISSIRQPIR